ncbi:MAG TPA: hypothetical protein VFX92_06360 [Candidatus Krumholzibacteria bacterium]|nr:hypothetical protein [Candidatus Krumholzibacteria bacterium]
MICALIDYWRYRRRPGRFGIIGQRSLMTSAYNGTLPDALVDRLRPGDILFIQSLHSFPAWLVMYLTKSEVSHVASYIGGKRIIHATFSGVTEEPLAVLFTPNTLLFACGTRSTSEQQTSFVPAARARVGRRYGWFWVVLKGLFIFTGRDPLYFRWSFFLDFAVLFVALGAPFVALEWFPFPLLLFPMYFLVVIMNSLIAHHRPLPVVGLLAKPVEVLMIAWAEGWDFYLNPAGGADPDS